MQQLIRKLPKGIALTYLYLFNYLPLFQNKILTTWENHFLHGRNIYYGYKFYKLEMSQRIWMNYTYTYVANRDATCQLLINLLTIIDNFQIKNLKTSRAFSTIVSFNFLLISKTILLLVPKGPKLISCVCYHHLVHINYL